MPLQRSNEEENNAKCHICASGLTYIEHTLYGNRCVFCFGAPVSVGLIEWMCQAFMDFCLYRAMVEMITRMGYQGARMRMAGELGALGYIDINQVKTIKQKSELLKCLRK